MLALRETGRPVIASMATVAGSGGYYVAMPCDAVVAGAATITGSIGVLGGKQVVRDALGRVGVRVDSESVGAHAEMFSSQRPFTDEEWRRLEEWLDQVYEDFTEKAAADRGMPVERLRDVARGRVWTGADALAHGLVEIGPGGGAEALHPGGVRLRIDPDLAQIAAGVLAQGVGDDQHPAQLPVVVDLVGLLAADRHDLGGERHVVPRDVGEPGGAAGEAEGGEAEGQQSRGSSHPRHSKRVPARAPDPPPARRGTAVHSIPEAWSKHDRHDPAKLVARAHAMLDDTRTHPIVRALWRPRLIAAVEWIAGELAAQVAAGRQVLGVEESGAIEIAGVTLTGKYDRIDVESVNDY